LSFRKTHFEELTSLEKKVVVTRFQYGYKKIYEKNLFKNLEVNTVPISSGIKPKDKRPIKFGTVRSIDHYSLTTFHALYSICPHFRI